MTTGKTLLAVVAGVAAGAALGLILAPKGSDTRKKITKIGGDLAEALNDKIDERFDRLVEAIAGKMKQAKSANGVKEKVDQEFQA